MKTTRKLESEYPCSPSLVYFFISAVVKKNFFFPLVVQLYHAEGAGQYLNNSSNSCLPVKGKITLSLFQQEETTMGMTDAWGNFKMKAWDGGREGGEQILNRNQLWNSECKYLCPFLASGTVLPREQDVLVFNNSQTRC